ncbi:hypothetical protein ACFQI7_20240 [Paenibacillus allorhizosphaerae]|uniref:DUF4872 domain-containing protein n=1 Tax=Paenibacillus allorhizosphaerae TaxID=2849866 RepID=A0ABM8VKP3_9BACL|nr:hypothetical protein [Paenibacillus allorhizosphaerae]CAG7647482.1 hypothetical protein PAECIP111802_03985 [Paenibacillus allorhizosphaerae]
MKRTVTGLTWTRESKTFVDCLHAVLVAAGLSNEPKYMLSGKTGMAFKFCVHKELLPLSVTAYGEWIEEHQPAAENIGIASAIYCGHTRHHTFPLYREAFIREMKASIERGVGVIFWEPEFCVIHGYDDDDEVFFYSDGRSHEEKIKLYDNFGLNFTPYWYAHLILGQVERDPLDVVLQSLRTAVREWETPYKTPPNIDIGSGQLAYRYWIAALEKGGFHPFGASYILSSAAYSRRELHAYFREIAPLIPGLTDVIPLYNELDALYQDGLTRHSNNAFKLAAMLKEAAAMEERTVQCIRAIIDGYPAADRPMPRWGSAPPR